MQCPMLFLPKDARRKRPKENGQWIWSCRKSVSAQLKRSRQCAATDAKCPQTPPTASFPPHTSTRTQLTPGCLFGCRCTAPGSDRSSPAPTSRDARTTFWKGRPAGNASFITSQCECFYFHNHPHPVGIQGHNCSSTILINSGVNCACRSLETLGTKRR